MLSPFHLAARAHARYVLKQPGQKEEAQVAELLMIRTLPKSVVLRYQARLKEVGALLAALGEERERVIAQLKDHGDFIRPN